MPEAAEEELPGALPVRVRVEPEAEVGDVQVDGQGDGGEGPRGDVQDGGGRAQCDQGQAVAQRDTAAQGRLRDRHHAVAASGVVLAEAPAQGVEVRKLPGVEDSSQKKGSCPRCRNKEGSKDTCHQRLTKAAAPSLTAFLAPGGGPFRTSPRSASLMGLLSALLPLAAWHPRQQPEGLNDLQDPSVLSPQQVGGAPAHPMSPCVLTL